MSRLFTSASVLCAASLAVCIVCPAALGDNLPPGTYVYLGESVGQDNPKLLRVDSDGSVVWQGRGSQREDSSIPRTISQKPLSTKGALSQKGRALANTQFSSYDYPTIIWKPKPLGGFPNAIAQLSTTFEMTPYGTGNVKIKLTLMRAPADALRSYTLIFLDRNGFRLSEKRFFSNDLHVLPGSGVLQEGHANLTMTEADYKRAADYTVD